MGIARDSRHKHRKTGGRRNIHQKKRKFEMGRPPAMTKLGAKRVRPVRCRGGNMKYRALRLDSGNYAWGSENCTRKVRILDVVYNATSNELVRTKTLLKNTIVQIDAQPYKQWYLKRYGVDLGKKAKGGKKVDDAEEKGEKRSRHVIFKQKARLSKQKLDPCGSRSVALCRRQDKTTRFGRVISLCMASLSFRELVRGLVAEHERELTDLRLEIKHLNGLLGEQSAGTKSNGHARCTGPKDDETVRPGNDEDVQDNDLSALDPELPRAMGSFIRVDTADVDVAAASVGLALDENLPERESFARAVTQKIARWTATVPGFRADQVTPLLHGLHWWMSLKEPPRTGLMASIVNSRLFTLLCYVVIALNAILIVHSSNAEMERALHNDVADYTEETRSYFIANCVFIGFYTAELLLKFYVHRIFMFANDDYRWNLFDVGLVGFGAIDLLYASSDRGVAVNWSFLRLLRIVRVVKVFRALKAMESVHDVSLMVECVTNTTSTLFWCLVLMMFVVAIFGLIFVQALAEFVAEQQDSLDLDLRDDIREHFGSVRIAMTSLFEATTGGVDWHDQYALCGNVGFALQLVYLFFQAFFVIVAWNVVTSMFVEKAFRLAVPDAEQLIQEKEHRDARYACEMMRLLHDSMDVDHNDRITLDEFKQRANHPSFRNFLEVRGVDFKNPKAFFEMLRSISGNDWVDCKTFVACCLQLQGAATNIDLQSLHYEIRKTLIQQGERLSGVEELIRKQSVAFVRHENSDGGSSTGNGTVCTI